MLSLSMEINRFSDRLLDVFVPPKVKADNGNCFSCGWFVEVCATPHYGRDCERFTNGVGGDCSSCPQVCGTCHPCPC